MPKNLDHLNLFLRYNNLGGNKNNIKYIGEGIK